VVAPVAAVGTNGGHHLRKFSAHAISLSLSALVLLWTVFMTGCAQNPIADEEGSLSLKLAAALETLNARIAREPLPVTSQIAQANIRQLFLDHSGGAWDANCNAFAVECSTDTFQWCSGLGLQTPRSFLFSMVEDVQLALLLKPETSCMVKVSVARSTTALSTVVQFTFSFDSTEAGIKFCAAVWKLTGRMSDADWKAQRRPDPVFSK
jgi:hypothetical protein